MGDQIKGCRAVGLKVKGHNTLPPAQDVMPERPFRIGAGAINAHHIGAKIGQKHPAERPRPQSAKLDHAQPVQWTRHGIPPLSFPFFRQLRGKWPRGQAAMSLFADAATRHEVDRTALPRVKERVRFHSVKTGWMKRERGARDGAKPRLPPQL